MNDTEGLQQRIAELETDLRHLENELRLTRTESEAYARQCYDLFLRLEEKVRERTRELDEVNRLLLAENEERRRAETEKTRLIEEIQRAAAEVKTLSGLLPICASCKKIRDDKGYWSQLEEYIRAHSEAKFTHSICPACTRDLYPELFEGEGKGTAG